MPELSLERAENSENREIACVNVFRWRCLEESEELLK
jgi:hypothetical protein